MILSQLLLILPLIGLISSAFLHKVLKPSWAYKITRYCMFLNFTVSILLLKEYVFSFGAPEIIIKLTTKGLPIPVLIDLYLAFFSTTSISCFLVTFGLLFCYIQNTKKGVSDTCLRGFGSFICLFTFLILLLITMSDLTLRIDFFGIVYFITIQEGRVDCYYFPRIFVVVFLALCRKHSWSKYHYYYEKVMYENTFVNFLIITMMKVLFYLFIFYLILM